MNGQDHIPIEFVTNANNSVATMANRDYILTFQQFEALFVFLYTLILIIMLQRTKQLGDMITMLISIVHELIKFLQTFSLIFLTFIIFTQDLSATVLKYKQIDFWESYLDLVKLMSANQNFKEYTNPEGVTFVVIFLYVINIMILSFLIAMYINRYNNSYVNLESVRRSNIIKLKNSNSYNPHYGALTTTFFPISIVCLPFMIFLVIFKSERLNDFVLKI